MRPPGSSPLTRGKLVRTGHVRPSTGLIPAHAGKTPAPAKDPHLRAAHPRSRGENSATPTVKGEFKGSSPLTRGKRGKDLLRAAGGRLIPAHAGKTA